MIDQCGAISAVSTDTYYLNPSLGLQMAKQGNEGTSSHDNK
ncbi:hypothetical protein [Moritella sp.]|nr:hypothetical protein [Moritella sp.]